MNHRRWIFWGAWSAGIAVAMGALAAHGLESWLSEHFPTDAEKRLANWKTAATYQMFHSLGMILVGIVGQFTTRDRWIGVSGWTMLTGILLFSGMLYAWVLTDIRLLVMIVPLGGLCFIAGWAALAMASWSIERLHRPQVDNNRS